MSNGYEEAKGQRNWLERLGAKIPGFRGFQDRELRRDVDKLQRDHLSAELTRLKDAIRDKARAYTDAGRIAALGGFDRLDRQVDGLSQTVRFADYGATGLFDPVKIGEPELERIYQFDLSLLDDLTHVESEVAALPPPGDQDPGPAVDKVLQLVRALEDKWRSREQVISNVVQTSRTL